MCHPQSWYSSKFVISRLPPPMVVCLLNFLESLSVVTAMNTTARLYFHYKWLYFNKESNKWLPTQIFSKSSSSDKQDFRLKSTVTPRPSVVLTAADCSEVTCHSEDINIGGFRPLPGLSNPIAISIYSGNCDSCHDLC